MVQGFNVRTSEAKGPGLFNGVKVFSATMVAQRDALGGVVTAWVQANPQLAIVDLVVSQSSDASFHCIAISVFYLESLKRAG